MPDRLLIHEPFWNLPRWLSIAIASGGLIGVCIAAGAGSALRALFAVILPIACIWWPDVVGSTLLGTLAYGKLMTHETPEAAVLVIGWILMAAWILLALAMMLGFL